MFCTQCGFNNRDDAKFCKSCGKPLKASPTQANTQSKIQSSAQQYVQSGRQQAAQSAGNMAKKTGGGIGKKLLGIAAIVVVVAVGIPFIRGVIEGVQEVTNNPPVVDEPIRNDTDQDYTDGKKAETLPPVEKEKGVEDEVISGDICPENFKGEMQLFEQWTNADVYNEPWRAQAVSDWTAQVEISRDILQMTVSDRPAYENWGTTYKQSGFALVGHVTREAMQTDAMKERDIIRYFGVIDNDFDVDEEFSGGGDLSARTLHAKGDRCSFELDVYPNDQYTLTLYLGGSLTEYKRNDEVIEIELSELDEWEFNLANRDVFYLYPDDFHVNED